MSSSFISETTKARICAVFEFFYIIFASSVLGTGLACRNHIPHSTGIPSRLGCVETLRA